MANPVSDAQVLYQALSAEAAMKAAEIVRNDFGLYWILISGFVTLASIMIGFFGFAQFRDIRSRLREEIMRDVSAQLNSPEFSEELRRAVEKSLMGELKADLSRLDRQIELGRLQRLVEQGADEEKVKSPEARASLFDKIWLLKDDPDIVRSSEFRDALDVTLSVLFRHSEWNRIDQLDHALRDYIGLHPILFVPFFQSFAFRALAEVSNDANCLKNFYIYYDICRGRNYLEYSLPYILPYEYFTSQEGASARILAAFEDLGHLPHADIAKFIEILVEKTDVSNLAKSPGPQHHRITNKTVKFMEAYKPQLDRLKRQIEGDSPKSSSDVPPASTTES